MRLSTVVRTSVLAALALVASACLCMPGINPALKESIDKRVIAYGGASRTFAAAPFRPLPFAAGQYIVLLSKDADGQPSITTQKVLSVDGPRVKFEFVTETYTNTSASQMTLDIKDRLSPSGMQIVALRMKDENGNVTEQPPQMLAFMRGMFEGMLQQVAAVADVGAAERVQVPAGVFEGAVKARSRVSVLGRVVEADGWSHPAVPISGLVKSVSSQGSMELVEFGTTGATASF